MFVCMYTHMFVKPLILSNNFASPSEQVKIKHVKLPLIYLFIWSRVAFQSAI